MLFFILPWCVDVPRERLPLANWLIILVTIGVFALQVFEVVAAESGGGGANGEVAAEGVTQTMVLDGWGLRGLLGYMWLHGGIGHLLGNMWFLWIFGNAVCAKIGNMRYLLLYVLLGVAAGVTHLVVSSGSAVGASGAMNGVVGMYLVLFFENNITCYFVFWFLVYVRVYGFALSSCWMILFWLFWDLVGIFDDGSRTAHFAHLGGFGAGFGIALLMCKYGWITMERYEKSLLQMWQERKEKKQKVGGDLSGDPLGVSVAAQEAAVAALREAASEREARRPKSIPLLSLEDGLPAPPKPPDGSMRLGCECGQKLKVSEGYAGKVVQCPRCKKRISVPGGPSAAPATRTATRARGSDSGAAIRFACRCGKRIRVPAHLAGRTGKCPQCGCRLRVPRAS